MSLRVYGEVTVARVIAPTAAPLALRKPFVQLARSIIPEAKVLAAIRAHAQPKQIADLLPAFHPRDLHGPWWAFVADMRRALAQQTHAGAMAARKQVRVRKDDRGSASGGSGWDEIGVPISERAKKWVDERAAEMCVRFSADQREVVRLTISDGFRRNLRPEEIARALRASVGLLPQHVAAVEKYRERLELDDRDPEQVERMTTNYGAKLLSYRTSNIARSETRTAVEHGRLFEYQGARDSGELPANQKKRWITAESSHRLCDACEEMDGQEVELDEDFHSDELGIDVPAPTLHPSCRCEIILA